MMNRVRWNSNGHCSIQTTDRRATMAAQETSAFAAAFDRCCVRSTNVAGRAARRCRNAFRSPCTGTCCKTYRCSKKRDFHRKSQILSINNNCFFLKNTIKKPLNQSIQTFYRNSSTVQFAAELSHTQCQHFATNTNRLFELRSTIDSISIQHSDWFFLSIIWRNTAMARCDDIDL